MHHNKENTLTWNRNGPQGLPASGRVAPDSAYLGPFDAFNDVGKPDPTKFLPVMKVAGFGQLYAARCVGQNGGNFAFVNTSGKVEQVWIPDDPTQGVSNFVLAPGQVLGIDGDGAASTLNNTTQSSIISIGTGNSTIVAHLYEHVSVTAIGPGAPPYRCLFQALLD